MCCYLIVFLSNLEHIWYHRLLSLHHTPPRDPHDRSLDTFTWFCPYFIHRWLPLLCAQVRCSFLLCFFWVIESLILFEYISGFVPFISTSLIFFLHYFCIYLFLSTWKGRFWYSVMISRCTRSAFHLIG